MIYLGMIVGGGLLALWSTYQLAKQVHILQLDLWKEQNNTRILTEALLTKEGCNV